MSGIFPSRRQGAWMAFLMILVGLSQWACGGGGSKADQQQPLAAPVIAYTGTPYVFTVGMAVAPLTPSNSGGAATDWSIAPPLPTGLTFNSSSGQIGGTPTATSAAASYTVTATNAAGSGKATLQLSVSASSGAWETPLVESSLPSLQINVAADGGRQWLFANMLRSSDAWITKANATPAEAQALADGVQVDASGWPILPTGAQMEIQTGYSTGGGFLHGVYVLTWEGSGTVELQSTRNDGASDEETLLNDQAHGRIVKLIKTPEKAAIVFVRASDPANHVRNLRLWAPATDGAGLSLTKTSDLSAGHVTGSLEPAPGAAEPMWHPRFLQHLAETPKSGVLRFMDWLKINSDTWDKDPLDWSDKADPSAGLGAMVAIDKDYTRYQVKAYHQRLGLPYEWMIDLCNATGKDLWIQVPHVASEDLIRKLADLCAARLDPKLRVWFEYSNEIWNTAGAYLVQHNKARDTAAAHFGVPAAQVTDDQVAWGSGHLQGLALKAFEDEWRAKGMPDARLINVVASFVGSPGFSQKALEAVKEIDPNLPEVLAVTNYFGSGTQGDIFSLQAFGAHPGVWPADLYERTKAIVRRNLYETTASWSASAAVAKKAGVPLVAYEGGQHLLPMGLGDWNNPAHADFMNYMYAFQRSPQIKDLYLEHYALWKAMGGRMASLFVDTGGWSFWGYWGAKELVTQTRAEARKWDAFLTWGELEAGVRAPSEPIGSRPVLPELSVRGEVGRAFSQDLAATGGDGTVALAVVGGALPPGLTFTQTGSGAARISGLPTTDGLYRFVVRALDADGDPDYRAYTLSIDPAGVTSNALVAFRGADIPGTLPNNGWISRYDAARPATTLVNGAGKVTRRYIPFSLADGQALFNKENLEVPGTPMVISATSPLTMYGGWSHSSETGADAAALTSFIGLRDHQWLSWSGDSNGGASSLDALLLWRADQFNTLGGSGTYSFGSDATTALLRVDLTALIGDGDNELRFVIRDNGAFYLSEAAYTSPYLGDGYFQLSGFSGSSAPGQRWAVFTPTADAYAIPSATTLTFAPRTFNNVQAVGLAYHGRRWGYHYAVGFSRFLALGRRQ